MIPSILSVRFIAEALRRRLDLGVGAPEPSGPLDYPDLRRMSPRQLDDLPLPRPVAAEADALEAGHDLAA